MSLARLAIAARRLTLATTVVLAAACADDDDPITPPPPPAAPAGVAVSANGATGATVTWTAVTGATSYVVERVTGATGGTFAEVSRPTAATYADAGLTAGTTYRYRVAAVNGTTPGAYSNEISYTVQQPAPGAPTGLTVTASGTGASVAWTAVAGATGYVVERVTGATGGSFAEVGRPTASPYADANLAAGTTYRYRVAALNGAAVGPFSPEVAYTRASGPTQRTLTGTLATQTLRADTTYVLSGFVQVPSGQTLTIQPGTRIVGDTTVPGSALFVLKGGRILAEGTAAAPIVFTSQRAVGNRRPGDWGGLIVIGNARINRPSPTLLEGSNANVGGVQYPGFDIAGGTNDDDDSGTLRYVRVEFAGYAVTADNELNSFTFASVGRGTTLEYLQAMGGLDDSFEWFGGTVDGRYLVSYLAGDDHFDAAEGYRGRNQFLIALQDTVLVPRTGSGQTATDPTGFEIDGCNTSGTNCPSQSAAPFTTPVFANFTIIGGGPAIQATTGGQGMVIRRGAGGYYVNGVVTRWGRLGLSVRDSSTNNRRLADSLQIRNVLFAENGATLDPSATNFTQPANFANSGIDSTATAAASLFTAVPALGTAPTAAGLNFAPAAGSPLASGGLSTFTGALAARVANFFGGTLAATAYRGAATPGGTAWWQGWTSYARN
ncbi:fibronectin type III domain-containing protein [Roseisolibacter sp. H3M3-2]|uniref:fibronectin type III domain-containing protein n=1 Tax=Roseisolibacter sp. H3M3-2 TaxID=3031323 RepID=UPI0023DB4648|nr:fibronectin type III domain-containing protein [Roseisolibacter sp. H3M3-2]MDF1501912.1 fibronectin type III domain-containing protein [Roseisolibacter sp. H3M3-2]